MKSVEFAELLLKTRKTRSPVFKEYRAMKNDAIRHPAAHTAHDFALIGLFTEFENLTKLLNPTDENYADFRTIILGGAVLEEGLTHKGLEYINLKRKARYESRIRSYDKRLYLAGKERKRPAKPYSPFTTPAPAAPAQVVLRSAAQEVKKMKEPEPVNPVQKKAFNELDMQQARVQRAVQEEQQRNDINAMRARLGIPPLPTPEEQAREVDHAASLPPLTVGYTGGRSQQQMKEIEERAKNARQTFLAETHVLPQTPAAVKENNPEDPGDEWHIDGNGDWWPNPGTRLSFDYGKIGHHKI